MIRAVIVIYVMLSLTACSETGQSEERPRTCKLCSREVEVLPGREGSVRVMSYCAGHASGNDGLCNKRGCDAETERCATDGRGSMDACARHVGACIAEGCAREAEVEGRRVGHVEFCIPCKVDEEERLAEAEREQVEKLEREAEERRRIEDALRRERRRREGR